MQLAFPGVFQQIFSDLLPCKTLAGRTKIDVQQGPVHRITFAKWTGQCYIWKPKKLENETKNP